MSSILTNTSAMVALQTLKGINSGLNQVQSEISTGKRISTAKDNAAIWSITKTMEADVKGFKGIAESLSLGSSALSVGANAAESVQKLLTDMKAKIVSAQSENVPRETLQTDINALRSQISGIVSAAQFSGLNLVSGYDQVAFLSSLDRSDSGVEVNNINVNRQDLTSSSGTVGQTAVAAATLQGLVAVPGNSTTGQGVGTNAINASNAGHTGTLSIGGGSIDASSSLSVNIGTRTFTVTGQANATGLASALAAAINAAEIEGLTASSASEVLTFKNTNAFNKVEITATASGATTTLASPAAPSTGADIGALNGSVVNDVLTINARAETFSFTNASVAEGTSFTMNVAGAEYSYVAAKGNTMEDIVRGLKTVIDGAKIAGLEVKVSANATTGKWDLSIDNSTGTAKTLLLTSATGGVGAGGLFGLDYIDVTNAESAKTALDSIETLISKATKAAANIGSAQTQMDVQAKFISSLTDAMNAGIGTLVDADLEEASARLQALQVQQQLGIQALTIANQQPQNLLALFR